jgi:sporulation protein YlmC with PRC-barrel domain
MMGKLLAMASVAAVLTGPAYAQHSQTTGTAPSSQAQTLTNLPQDTSTVTNWYKQDVYDPSETKIGEIKDVLVGKDGKINAFIISAGGFVGAGEKDVAVPFDQVHGTERNGKWWLTMNTTKDALKNATGFKYDKGKATWVPA